MSDTVIVGSRLPTKIAFTLLSGRGTRSQNMVILRGADEADDANQEFKEKAPDGVAPTRITKAQWEELSSKYANTPLFTQNYIMLIEGSTVAERKANAKAFGRDYEKVGTPLDRTSTKTLEDIKEGKSLERSKGPKKRIVTDDDIFGDSK